MKSTIKCLHKNVVQPVCHNRVESNNLISGVKHYYFYLETLKFLSNGWMRTQPPFMKIKFVKMGDAVVFACDTNDPKATVTLGRKESTSQPYTSAKIWFDSRIEKVGQNVSVQELTFSDAAYYECTANNGKEIKLYLGQLHVTNVN